MSEHARAVRQLVAAAGERYRAAGRFAYHFARGKLAADPAFRAILERGLVADGSLLDIGCGQGLLASWLLAAREAYAAGRWPAHWPAPPLLSVIHGIELMTADVERARKALDGAARFVVGDMRSTPFPSADTAVILDVLHYVPHADQEEILSRVRDALSPSGTLLLRIGDADAGFLFRWSNWVDHTVMVLRGHGPAPIHCRPAAEWKALLARLGFCATATAMSDGTLFANVLFAARRA